MLPSRPARARSIAKSLSIVNLVAASSFAWAHPEFNPVSVNRYVKFDLLSASELRLAYTVMFGDQPAHAMRREMDAVADGRLDEAETRALGERVRALVSRGLALQVDGKPVAPAFEAPQVGLMGEEVGPAPFSVDLIARVPAPGPAPHTVRFDDQTELPRLGELEVKIEESPGTTLLSAHRGPPERAAPGEKQAHLVFKGPKLTALEDRSVAFSFTGAAVRPAQREAPRTGVWVGVGLGVLALGAAAVVFLRRRG